jgi:hypothetical protein
MIESIKNSKVDFGKACKNAFAIYFFILAIQFFYLTVLTKVEYINIIVFFILGVLGGSLLWVVSKNIKGYFLIRFNSNIFIVLFILTAITTILLSRYEYILNTISNGLVDTRLNTAVGAGGLYSILNVMFYPLAMLGAFYKKPSWQFHFIFYVTILVCAIDVLFLGTRNSVFFVLLFRFLFSESEFCHISKKFIFYSILMAIIFFIAFEYTTRERSGFNGDAIDYWFEKSMYSNVMSSSILNVNVYRFFGDISYIFLVLFYLIAYLTHSVPEFILFIQNFKEWQGTLAHLQQYYLLYTFQDSSLLINYLEYLRFRSGLYQTLYASLIVDFGVWTIFFPLLLILMHKVRSLVVLQLYILPVIMLSSIENYFYTGLTPLRFFLFFVLGQFFIGRNVIRRKDLYTSTIRQTNLKWRISRL